MLGCKVTKIHAGLRQRWRFETIWSHQVKADKNSKKYLICSKNFKDKNQWERQQLGSNSHENEKLHVDKQTNNSPNILVGKRPFPLTSAAIMIQHVGMFCGACANPAAN